MNKVEQFSNAVSDNLFCLLYQAGYIDRTLEKVLPDLRKCEVEATLEENPLAVAKRLYGEFSKFMDDNGFKICPHGNWNRPELLVFACQRYNLAGVVDSDNIIFRTRAPFVRI
jgi:hypothetical protein